MRKRDDPSSYNDWSNEIMPWDARPSSGAGVRKLLVALVGLLLVAGVVAGAYFLLADKLFDSPERAARVWVQALMEGDMNRLNDRTCNDQSWIVNARTSSDSLAGMLAVEPMIESLGASDLLSGLNQSVSGFLDNIDYDLSELIFDAPKDASGRAVVNVSGKLRVKVIGNAWFSIPFNDRWVTIEEGGNWRWCGREP